MASVVEIVNRALTKIGAQRILALTDDTASARAANSLYEIVRDAELRHHRWNFAIMRASLPALSDAPAFGYDYQYQLPSDCLRVLEVGDYSPGIDLSDYRGTAYSDYQIEGGKILTDYDAPLNIRYVGRIEDPTLFDALFVESLAARLAVELAPTFELSTDKKKMLFDEYKLAISQAKLVDAIENPPELLPDDSWILSRL